MVRQVEQSTFIKDTSNVSDKKYKVDEYGLTAIITEKIRLRAEVNKFTDPITAAKHIADEKELKMFYGSPLPVGYNFVNVATWVLVVATALLHTSKGLTTIDATEEQVDSISTSNLSIDQLLEIKSKR